MQFAQGFSGLLPSWELRLVWTPSTCSPSEIHARDNRRARARAPPACHTPPSDLRAVPIAVPLRRSSSLPITLERSPVFVSAFSSLLIRFSCEITPPNLQSFSRFSFGDGQEEARSTANRWDAPLFFWRRYYCSSYPPFFPFGRG